MKTCEVPDPYKISPWENNSELRRELEVISRWSGFLKPEVIEGPIARLVGRSSLSSRGKIAAMSVLGEAVGYDPQYNIGSEKAIAFWNAIADITNRASPGVFIPTKAAQIEEKFKDVIDQVIEGQRGKEFRVLAEDPSSIVYGWVHDIDSYLKLTSNIPPDKETLIASMVALHLDAVVKGVGLNGHKREKRVEEFDYPLVAQRFGINAAILPEIANCMVGIRAIYSFERRPKELLVNG